MLVKNAPIPYPAMIVPVTNPFLLGKCDHAQNRAVGYKKPAPIPYTNPKKSKKVLEFFVSDAATVAPQQISPPSRIVLPLNKKTNMYTRGPHLRTVYIPIGANTVWLATTTGSKA